MVHWCFMVWSNMMSCGLMMGSWVVSKRVSLLLMRWDCVMWCNMSHSLVSTVRNFVVWITNLINIMSVLVVGWNYSVMGGLVMYSWMRNLMVSSNMMGIMSSLMVWQRKMNSGLMVWQRMMDSGFGLMVWQRMMDSGFGLMVWQRMMDSGFMVHWLEVSCGFMVHWLVVSCGFMVHWLVVSCSFMVHWLVVSCGVMSSRMMRSNLVL